MTEHLSSLQLDEIAAGLVAKPEHLTSCAECSSKLATLEKQNAAFLAMPRAQAQRADFAKPKRRAVLWLVPLAAAIAIGVFVQRDDSSERLKGSASIVLLDARGEVVTDATVGQKLTLAVGGAGARSVKVVDAASGEEIFAGPITAGARVPLTELEVTPGDVTLRADFDDGASAQVRL
ncbi:MAG: hypothetical protein ACO1OB_26720, partial [Archangium sp.]